MHHIGFAVRSPENSRLAFEALGAQFFHETMDKTRNLKFQFAKFGDSEVLVELVSPLDNELPCAVTKMVEKQACTLYHICLEVYELESEIERLRGMGFWQMGKPITSDIYGYETSGVFLFGTGIGVVELVQRCRT